MTKARLRSRSTFSPVEQILERAIENYKRDLRAARAQRQKKLEQQHQVQITKETTSVNENSNENIYEMVSN